ncbi:MAG: septal ring lytic transglycosylase RlpA family protein [Prolixibacteraceae bacterium]|nr:septal ring lytic transglycosylase RlpA family protein [Burkholderiales bacterium]
MEIVRGFYYSVLSPQSSVLAMAIAVAITLAGCGSSPSRPAASKPGGYYLDDGPGSNPPANLELVSDPMPKVEPINKYTSRPYTVLGRTYRPYAQLTPYKARGEASWYGKRYHGQKTSSGEVYDMYAMTAAHTILPLPSFARVTNVANGKSVVVRVNDRGPFHEDRLIDLSYLAAQRLGLLGSGSGIVEVEAIIPGNDVPPVTSARLPEADAAPVPAAVTAEPGGIYVQLGAFSVAQNADAFLRKMRLDLNWLSDSMAVYGKNGVYRVQAGPYSSREEAGRAAQRVQKELGFKALVLDR